jgi:gliding motility-associated-like protein
MSVSITGGDGSYATEGYVCKGSDYTVVASGADSYLWSTGDTVGEIKGTNLVTPMAYTVTGYNFYNCETKVNVTVPLMTLPKVRINASKTAVCPDQGDTIRFTATGAESYVWHSYPPISDIDNNPNLAEISAAVWDSGYVYVAGTDTNMCVGYDSIRIKVHTLEPIKYVINPTLIDENYNTVSMSGRTPSSELYNVDWTWEIGDGTVLNGKAVKHTFDVLEDSFLVTVHARDWNGCVYDSTSHIYKWKDVWAPDKFTPDGNGLNDKFQFEGGDWISEFDFIIYNRLGEVVFEGHSLRDAWDGTFKGKLCSPGVYGWTCSYKSTVGSYTKSGEEKGKITLIR